MTTENPYARGVRRALRASAYAVPIGALGSASVYLTNWILGRVSPELLGAYAGLLTMSGVVVSMFVLGGTNVLVHFSAGMDATEKSVFTSRYALVCLLGAAAGLGVVLLARGVGVVLPAAVRDVPMPALIAAVAGSTLSTTATGALLSQMRLVTAAVMSCLASLTLLLVCGLLWIGGLLSVDSVFWLVGGVYFLAGAGGWIIARVSWPHRVTSLRTGWPAGFWQYVLPLHASTVVVFLASTFDVFVVGSSGFAALGVYRVVIIARTLACWLPNMIHPPLYPVLRRALAEHDRETATSLVQLYSRLDSASAVFPAVSLILLVRLFVGTFGPGYSAAIPGAILAIAASGLLWPITQMGGTVLVAEGMMWQSLAINCVSLTMGWTTAGLLYKSAGLVGVSLAVGIATAVGTGLQVVVLRRMGWRLPLRWSAVSLVSLAVSCVVVLWMENRVAGAVIALTVTAGLALSARMITAGDFKRVLRGVATRKVREDVS